MQLKMNKKLVLNKVSFCKRFLNSCKKLDCTVYLLMGVIVLMSILIWKWLFIFLLYPFFTRFFETYKYIYFVESDEEFIYMHYLKCGKEEKIKVKKEHLKLDEYEQDKQVTSAFKLYYFDGKAYKSIINQYKIENWANQENVERLKLMLN